MMAGNGALYPVLGLAAFIAFVYLSFGDIRFHFTKHSTTTTYTTTSTTPFVARNGTHFTVDGASFYVNGWNSYWLMDQAVEDHSRPRVTAMFQAGAAMGLTVCRTWAFNDGTYNALQVSLGQFDERVFKALDRVVAEARMHGIRLILCLVNNLQAYGGKTQYVKWAWEDGIGLSASNDSFFFDPFIRDSFKLYIKTILTRKNHLTGIEYRDDPTIFAWELMNEPRCMSDPSGDTLQEWIEDMAGYVKSIDNKHLLTIGLEGFYGPTSPSEKLSVNPTELDNTYGADFIRNFKTSAIDFASVHLYPDQWLKGAEFDAKMKFTSRWVTSHIEDGEKELKKPVLLTEFGITKRNKNFDHSHLDAFYKFIYDIIRRSARKNKAGAGAFVWQLMASGMEEYTDDYGIVPMEMPSLYGLIKNHSCRLTAISYREDRAMRGFKSTC